MNRILGLITGFLGLLIWILNGFLEIWVYPTGLVFGCIGCALIGYNISSHKTSKKKNG